MMSGEKALLLREEYVSRINRVQDYIESNISEEFSLLGLSQIANFSPYHFHRIFSTMTGETPFHFIQRIRLEKAAFLLLANHKVEITQIALECGFSNQASFAKAFKGYFGISASRFRIEVSIQKRTETESDSNIGKVWTETVCYNSTVRNRQYYEKQKAADIPFAVQVKELSDMNVVYIRHTGPYKKNAVLFDKLFGKLFEWANERKLIHPTKTKWLTLFHHKLDLTEDHKIRISVCMTVRESVQVDGEVGRLVIPGGKYAIGRFELNADQYQDAWNAMSAKWLPESGYQPDDRLCFELYNGEGANAPQKQIVDICIPIKPL